MSYGIKFCKITGATVLMCGLLLTSKAQAFVWPVSDFAEITAFINDVNSNIQNFRNTNKQITKGINTIRNIGDQVSTAKKYVTDLRGSIASIKDTVVQITDDIEDISGQVEGMLNDVDGAINGNKTQNQNNAGNLTENIEGMVDSGAGEAEVQSQIDETEKETEQDQQKVNDILDKTSNDFKGTIAEANKKLDEMAEQAQAAGTGKDYNKEITEIRDELVNLEETFNSLIDDVRKDYNGQFDEKVTAAFDAYRQAVSDYYAGKLTREGLTNAGTQFKDSIGSMNTGIDTSAIDDLNAKAENVAKKTDNLKETIFNDIDNSQGYSDEEEGEKTSFWKNILPDSLNIPIDIKMDIRQKETGRYVFNFHTSNENIFFESIYADGEDKSFLLSKELKCEDLKEIKEIGKDASGFRKCVIKAKTEKKSESDPDPFTNPLYKPYRKDGVYAHITEDYSIANISSISKAKQFSGAWSDLKKEGEENKGTYYMLTKKLEDISNTRDAYILMGMIDIESPKIWSQLRRIDALNRSRIVVQDFKMGTTLYLDNDNEDYAKAYARNAQKGTIKRGDLNGDENDIVVGKNIFPNVIMNVCGLNVNDISFASNEEQKQEDIERKEKAIAECMYKYAKGASVGIEGDGKDSSVSGTDPEIVKLKWQEKQIAAYNDAALNSLTMAVVNNYKSSLDYADPQKLEDPTKDKNIISMQDGMRNSTTSRDDYASGAQINYYSTQQVLSILEADALDVQADIIRNLRDMTYNFFAKDEGGN